MSRIIVIAAAFVISIGASIPTFAQARPAASPTPTRPAQSTPVATPRPAAAQTTPVAMPANVPASKIALVDTTEFGDEKVGIRRYINAVNSVEKIFEPKTLELRNLQNQIKVIADDIAKLNNSPVVSPASVRAKQDEGERLQRDFKYKKEQADADFQKRYTELVGPISTDIGNALIQYASQNGLTMILDISKLAPAVLSVNPAMDVTQAFIADYNSKHP
jgi:Skp family chaperone for outer membrane proteins